MGAFDAGATGMVCGMGNIFPEVLTTMYHAYNAGDRTKAMETQRLVLKMRAITKLGPTVPIMHAILNMRGIDAGCSRSPLIEIDDATKAKVRKGLQDLNLLE
jgi:4-hydroxy-tetrahydrodipicolinate synthase